MATKATTTEKVDKPVTITVKVTLLEEMLGMSPSDPNIHEEYIASKAPDAPSMEEEIEAVGVAEAVAKAMTVFPRDNNGNPCLFDYQIKGMCKDSCGMLRRLAGTYSSKLTQYKKIIDGLIFVYPRFIPIVLPEGGEIGNCQRPLRAMTPQGERVALANSETVPAGSTLTFKIECMKEDYLKTVLEWLKYGAKRGLGQWRNAGFGRYDYEILEEVHG